MSRLDWITAVIVGVCLLALGFLVYKVVGLMNAKSAPPTEIIEDEPIPDYTYEDDLDDEAIPGPDPIQEDLERGGPTDYERDEMGDKAIPTPAEKVEPRRADPVPPPTKDGGARAGQYLVVAGTFENIGNAETQATKLRGMGYANTEVTIFDRGKYAVVLVERFDDLAAAQDLEKDLEAKGVSALVKKQRGSR